MQKIFDETEDTGTPEFVRFDLPADIKPQPIILKPVTGTYSRKRPRTPLSQRATSLSAPLRRGIAQVLEFGDRPVPAFASLQDTLAPSTDSTGSGHDAAAMHRVALRHALAVVGRVVMLDTSGLFISRTPTHSAPSEGPATATAAAATTPSSPSPSQSGDTHTESNASFALMELYSYIQSLELSLEDIQRQSSAVAGAQLPPLLQEVERAVNQLEATIISLLLAQPPSGTASTAASAAYVEQLLEQLPRTFAEAAWPSQLLAPVEGGRTGAENSAEGDGGLRERLGHGITAVLLEPLLAAVEDDVENVLGMAAAPPLAATVVAMQTRATAASGSTAGSKRDGARGSSSSTPTATPAAVTFTQVLAKAWAGGYASEGIRRALLELRLARYRLVTTQPLSTAPPTTSGGGGGGRARRSDGSTSEQTRQEEVCRLTRRLEAAIAARYRHLMTQFEGERTTPRSDKAACGLEDVEGMSPATVLGTGGKDGSALTATQSAALRVLDMLRASDPNGWFSVPAYDLVNVDFFSISRWVRRPCFATKSNPEAFGALRVVLEGMVDRCVATYGPTHKFSQCITAVRQRLVEAARQERLL